MLAVSNIYYPHDSTSTAARKWLNTLPKEYHGTTISLALVHAFEEQYRDFRLELSRRAQEGRPTDTVFEFIPPVVFQDMIEDLPQCMANYQQQLLNELRQLHDDNQQMIIRQAELLSEYRSGRPAAHDRYTSLEYGMTHDSHAAHFQLSWERHKEIERKPEVDVLYPPADILQDMNTAASKIQAAWRAYWSKKTGVGTVTPLFSSSSVSPLSPTPHHQGLLTLLHAYNPACQARMKGRGYTRPSSTRYSYPGETSLPFSATGNSELSPRPFASVRTLSPPHTKSSASIGSLDQSPSSITSGSSETYQTNQRRSHSVQTARNKQRHVPRLNQQASTPAVEDISSYSSKGSFRPTHPSTLVPPTLLVRAYKKVASRYLIPRGSQNERQQDQQQQLLSESSLRAADAVVVSDCNMGPHELMNVLDTSVIVNPDVKPQQQTPISSLPLTGAQLVGMELEGRPSEPLYSHGSRTKEQQQQVSMTRMTQLGSPVLAAAAATASFTFPPVHRPESHNASRIVNLGLSSQFPELSERFGLGGSLTSTTSTPWVYKPSQAYHSRQPRHSYGSSRPTTSQAPSMIRQPRHSYASGTALGNFRLPAMVGTGEVEDPLVLIGVASSSNSTHTRLQPTRISGGISPRESPSSVQSTSMASAGHSLHSLSHH
ncbi:hypothetical protein CEUSTIGMA_g7693.t1 [Chlamydomonas eustigma]|uniref:Uncharacterized protein n=1 Tax=Chlamydomonas eustigma TaxID=1157962 RepID=A0A250XAX5_9CHLO|nr:hypothetical protein CEUSTIGMA_g7693.t1 [Chlamydomonas eustigma]|eukprot:GAX80255.1 hypothetical protein CEUSTIGMA_g7693.t1 [Chlamydomonas eustigma]